MAHAELCPVCEGDGRSISGGYIERVCRGCAGSGWVTVRDEEEMRPPESGCVVLGTAEWPYWVVTGT